MASKKSVVKSEDLKQEDFLQAVVIADSFNVRFVPLTNDCPRTLLPLVNVPLLEYCLELLSASGVQRAIVFCCVHADMIKSYLANSKWTTSTSTGMEVLTVVSDGCMSVGDALRDLEAKSIIRSDFILIHGDLVSNLKLLPIIEEHRKRRSVIKGAVMTMVYREASPGHATRRVEDELVVAVQSKTQRVVGYQRVGGHSTKKFVLQREIFDNYSPIKIRHDLLDPHICICAPNVLQLMADNFDFETIDDLVRGILVNEDVLDVSLYIHAVHDDAYAARAADPVSYAAVSQDVMSRWSYPLVPDCNITGISDNSSAYHRHNLYLDSSVTLERGSTLVQNVAIGHNTTIGENATISHSVIGKNCMIGNNVRIKDSYLWDNVSVDDDCVIDNAIIDKNVNIGSKTVIKGALVGQNIKLLASTVVEPGTKLVSESRRNIDGMTIQPFKAMQGVFEYKLRSDTSRRVWDTWGVGPATVVESDKDSISSESDDDVGDTPALNEETMITDELAMTLQRAIDENISVENVIVEINSIKHAYGVEIKELNGLIAKTLFEMPLRGHVAQQYFPQFKTVTKQFLALLKNYFRTNESQTDLLMAAEEYAVGNETVMSLLPKLLHHLYDESDVLSEQVILSWWAQMQQDGRSPGVRKCLGKFIEWLETATEDDSDDED